MKKIKVIVVDDSAVIRGLMKGMMKDHDQIEVIGSASNGENAVALCEKERPDVCVMDIEMPVLDGIGALKQMIKKVPETKVIMCSSLTQKNAEITMKALEIGAVDTIAKPSSSSELNSRDGFQAHLIELVRSVGSTGKNGIKVAAKPSVLTPTEPIKLKNAPLASWRPKMVMIGSSTGGPQALFAVLKALKGKTSAPIVITQHMPPTFTKTLAEHITSQTGLICKEADEGMEVENGIAYLARGGMHMVVKKQGLKLSLSLDEGAPEHFCRPSVEPMMRSVMEIYPAKDLLGVILTGMGSDGVNSCDKLANEGGYVVAQDEESSVVWGMPGAVAKAGNCCAVLPLNDIGPWVAQRMG